MVVRKLFFACLVCSVACGDSCGKSSEGADAAAVSVAEPPVPQPAGVLAEVSLATPDATWKGVQKTVAGVLSLAPASFGGVLAMTVGADAALGDAIDGSAPAFAVVAGDEKAQAIVVAARLKSEAHARATLTDGDNAKFQASGSEQGIDVLEPKGAPVGWVLGVAHGGFLLAATSRADLGKLGPYAYRTLPTLPVGAMALVAKVPHAAISGPLRAWLSAREADAKQKLVEMDESLRKDHGGRAPDFGDPRALITALDGWAKGRIDTIADMDHGEIDGSVDDEGVGLVMTLTPASSGGSHDLVAAMRPGDASPILELPSGVPLDVLVRGDAADRAANAKDLTDTIKAMTGARLAEPDAKKLELALAAFAEARGDTFAFALGASAPTRGLMATFHTGDDAKSIRAISDLAQVASRPPLFGLLETSLDAKSTKISDADLPPLGAGKLVTVVRKPGASPPLPADVGAAFASKDGRAALGLGLDATALAKAAVAPEHKLAADAKVEKAVSRLGSDVTLAAVVVPTALASAPRSDAIVLGWGKRGGDAFASVEASGGAVRALIPIVTKGF